MPDTSVDLPRYFQRLHEELDRVERAEMIRWADAIYQAWENETTVFLLGNGGSGALASHLAEDLGKNAVGPPESSSGADQPGRQKRLRIMSLTDNTSWITALGNDLSFDQIFLQQLINHARPGDLVVAISGSGNSANVLAAVEWANQNGLKTFALTGFDGGRLKQIQQDGLHVPLTDMGMVESIHLCIAHWLVDEIGARVDPV